MERIYIETTVVSYLTSRPSRDVVIAGHQQITHDWWDHFRGYYELCASQLVHQEAADGDPQAAQDRMDVLAKMTILETREDALILAEALVQAGRCSAVKSSQRRAARRLGRRPSCAVLVDMELPSSGECDHENPN